MYPTYTVGDTHRLRPVFSSTLRQVDESWDPMEDPEDLDDSFGRYVEVGGLHSTTMTTWETNLVLGLLQETYASCDDLS